MQERDIRTKEICKKQSVALFYVNYWEVVSKDLIQKKLIQLSYNKDL
jgi:hypothetical protein